MNVKDISELISRIDVLLLDENVSKEQLMYLRTIHNNLIGLKIVTKDDNRRKG